MASAPQMNSRVMGIVMAMSLSPFAVRPVGLFGRVRAIWRDALALLFAVTDHRAGGLTRIVVLLVLIYAISPFHLVSYSLPGLGELDDALVVPALMAFAARRMPVAVLGKARERAGRFTKRWPLALLTVALLLGALYGLAVGVLHALQNW